MRALAVLSFFVLVTGCDNSSTNNNKCGGAPATGAMDTHCDGMPVTVVDPGACASPAPSPAPGGDDFGDTMYNTSGKDDDCKYAVSFTVGTSSICENTPTTFTVTATQLADNKPVTCDPKNVRAEVFLTDTHISPVVPTTTSSTPGMYVISNVQFNASGMWTVRFHFCENCTDLPESPHGHAAFYINVQ